MLLEVSWLVFRNEIMEGSCKEWKVTVVVVGNRVRQGLVLQGHKMLEVDIESGEVVYPKAVDLGYVVFVAGQGTRWGSPGQYDILDESS